jgi:hypothetical protein
MLGEKNNDDAMKMGQKVTKVCHFPKKLIFQVKILMKVGD